MTKWLLQIIEGAARILDIGGTMGPTIEPGDAQTDADALASDWAAVGADIQAAIDSE